MHGRLFETSLAVTRGRSIRHGGRPRYGESEGSFRGSRPGPARRRKFKLKLATRRPMARRRIALRLRWIRYARGRGSWPAPRRLVMEIHATGLGSTTSRFYAHESCGQCHPLAAKGLFGEKNPRTHVLGEQWSRDPDPLKTVAATSTAAPSALAGSLRLPNQSFAKIQG